MPDYRRILSYLYRYENGERKECTGFVKAEQRKQSLKLMIQIKDPLCPEEVQMLLLFYKKNQDSWEITRSDLMELKDGEEGSLLFYEKATVPDGFDIQDQYGIMICHQDSLRYGSVWIGKEIPADCHIQNQDSGTSAGSETKASAESENKTELAADESLELSMTQRELVQSEPVQKEQLQSEHPQNKLVPEKQLQSEQVQKERPQNGQMQREQPQSEPVPEEQIQSEPVPEEQIQSELVPEEQIQSELVPEEQIQSEPVSEEQMKGKQAAEGQSRKEQRQNELTQCQETESDEQVILTDLLQPLRDQAPKAEKIFNSAFYEGYEISPSQLVHLGEEADLLSVNQFLLKGFGRYNHLLAAKVLYDGEDRYCIGVPGMYENREKYMARLYQFPVFLSLSENRIKTGRYGYWLHMLS